MVSASRDSMARARVVRPAAAWSVLWILLWVVGMVDMAVLLQGRASMMRLTGELVATRTWPKPASRSTEVRTAGPAWAPRARCPGWASEVGVQTRVEAA